MNKKPKLTDKQKDKRSGFKPEGFFKCKNELKYLNISSICDGIINCRYGNDEIFCVKSFEMNLNLSKFCFKLTLVQLICNLTCQI